MSIVVLDQYTKFLALKNLNRGIPVKVIGDFFGFYLTKNPGGVFGTRIGSNTLYIVFSFIGLIFILFYIWQLFIKNNKSGIFASGLLFGGAIGNLIDRLRFAEVTDFIDMGIGELRWAKYNIADAAILIGLVILLISEFKDMKKQSSDSDGKTLRNISSDEHREDTTGSLSDSSGDSSITLENPTLDSRQTDSDNGQGS